jgi:hypothetical protein
MAAKVIIIDDIASIFAHKCKLCRFTGFVKD